jgi:hypothetical protein
MEFQNPYKKEEETVRMSANLFGELRIDLQTRKDGKKLTTERGELLKYFADKTARKIPQIAMKVQGLELRDLYYIKSACDSYEKQGNIWAKGFYGMLKPRPPET